MSGMAVAAGENVEETYFRRLFEVLGVKGTVILGAFPISLGVLSIAPDAVHPAVAGGILAVVFVYAVLIDREIDPEDSIDPVGVAFAILSFVYTVFVLAGVEFGWISSFFASVFVFGAVVYDYAFQEGMPDSLDTKSLQETDVDPLHLDVVGFVVFEILLVYSILVATGWGSFANSPTFGAIAFLVYIGTVATFAGYAVVTREVVVSRTDDELHEIFLGILGDIYDIENDILREDIASKMRRAADDLDGVKIPTKVEDEYGEVPAVVSKRKPERRCIEETAQEILDTASEAEFTGYIIHDENVLLFRNGNLSKYYRDGEYGYEADDLLGITGDATFHSLDHSTLNDLDDITPNKQDVKDPEKVKQEMEAEEEEEEVQDEAAQTLDIGGEEINMDEMFQKADEIMDDLSE